MLDIFKELSPFMRNVVIIYLMLNVTTGLILCGYVILNFIYKLNKCKIKSIDLSAGTSGVKVDIDTFQKGDLTK